MNIIAIPTQELPPIYYFVLGFTTIFVAAREYIKKEVILWNNEKNVHERSLWRPEGEQPPLEGIADSF
ncbi:hypothetical protein EHV15_34910 [Paenibacillus oralis]|uniref:Uncharacterized protein n=1 Tax=Paenibacillus oralis TaxID=2490856 RepID=A0A3P3TB80_9BACL|nr:hypothetical protein [Paenibacillus oralis]RRJ54784.1 hypothetical protein EHV15_34910 [Paenibacillus oralis]